jgi:hypothetical protein
LLPSPSLRRPEHPLRRGSVVLSNRAGPPGIDGSGTGGGDQIRIHIARDGRAELIRR